MEIEYKGIWWNPNEKNIKYPGTLKLTSNNSGILDIICLDSEVTLFKSRNFDIINGIANNTEFTLINCSRIKFSLTVPERSVYKVKFIILNKHYSSKNLIKIRNSKISFSYLNDWTNAEFYDFRFKNYKNLRLKKQPLSLQPTKKVNVKINPNFSLNIEFSYKCYQVPDTVEFRLERYVFFEMKFTKAINFDEFYDYFDKLNKFFCFAIQNSSSPNSILANKIKNKHQIEIRIESKYSKPAIKEHLQKSNMLFMFDDIEHKFSEVLYNWFNNFDKLKDIYTLYFGELMGNQFLETKFLSMIQVLESYHRLTFPKAKPKIPKKEFKKRKELILSKIPEKDRLTYKDWLDSSLFNSPSLKQRLEFYFEKFTSILDNYDNKIEFIEVAVNTRNSMSHALSSEKRKTLKHPPASDPNCLYNLYIKTKLIVDICLLYNLEFNDKDILSFINGFWKYSNVMKHKNYFQDYNLVNKIVKQKLV